MLFSPDQRSLVIQAVEEAEERTTRYYCIPPFRWQQLSYDLLTRQDTEWEHLPDPVLAKLQRIRKVGPKPGKAFDFYRIQLNDPRILFVARRENLREDFYDFLVYILTHEMVHMVRLSSILDPEKEAIRFVETEEERVQRISRQILVHPGYRPFESNLDRFSFTDPVNG